MNLWQEYVRPATVGEALEALRDAPGTAIPIAGGTDLMLDLQQGRHSPVHRLVDLTSVREMTALEVRGEDLFIGAAVPVNRIVQHELVRRHAQALVEACDLIGGPQVRNMATLGGNVVHALPAADGTIALTILDVQVQVAGLTGERSAAFTSLFAGPGKSNVKAGEDLVVGFTLPLKKSGQASCFKRIMRPQGVALPILNSAVWVERDGNVVRDARIAVGPGGPVPFRAGQAESYLRGQPVSDETIERALREVLAESRFRTSPQRASSEYRVHLISGLFRDTLLEAWARTMKD